MGIYRGPNIVRDGLVFGYDDGYNSSGEQLSSGRYFKGPAHTNLIEEIDPSFTNTNTATFKGVSGEEEVTIPIVGKRTVKYVDYFNDYPTSGDCCPNLFHYHGTDNKIPVVASTSYTYSIIYKHSHNYTHPNFMYRYEYQTNNTYNTEAGFHSTASDRRTHLGDGWYHAWGSFTTQSTTGYVKCYSFLYNYGTVEQRYSVAAVSLVKNETGSTHFIIPPQLMLEPLGSVSNTASLIDLKDTIDIDVSNVSFDSTGQPTFDGTNDYINIPSSNVFDTQTVTVEVIVKPYSTSQNGFWFEKGAVNTQYSLFMEGNNIVWRTAYGGTTDSLYFGSSNMTANAWNHVVGTYTAGDKKAYLNSTLMNSNSLNVTLNTNQGNQYIGSFNSNGYFYNGEIAIVKIYNKALSAGEVRQNFNAYKNRFNI
jgi:hypothetical protein